MTDGENEEMAFRRSSYVTHQDVLKDSAPHPTFQLLVQENATVL